MSADAKIQELGLELPAPQVPAGTYMPVVQVGNLIYVSGHGPLHADGTQVTGRVGGDLTEEQAADLLAGELKKVQGFAAKYR